MNVIECKQGTQEWFEARAGKVTASSVADAMAFLKRGDKQGAETAARANYKARIVHETLCGRPALEGYLSPWMEHGTEYEPFARAAYEAAHDVLVDTVGFVLHPTIERAGASPDGLVGDNGLLEIKCPKPETHLRYMLGGVLPAEYEPQVMFQLACTGRAWCDFVSFDPRMPLRHQIFTVRVQRDDTRIAQMEEAIVQFLAEVDEQIAALNAMNPPLEAEIAGPQPAWDSLDTLGITDEELDMYLPMTAPEARA